MNDDSGNAIPEPIVETPDKLWQRLRAGGIAVWIMVALCAVVAIILIVGSVGSAGIRIVVHFQQGHGIKPGDVLRHRGIEVGTVERVELSSDMSGVDVAIRLQRRASGLAHDGSQFWIERPRVSLARVAGLDTVVGAKYVAVQPGPSDAAVSLHFEGLENPLSLVGADAVNVIVRFRQGYGLAVGDPVKYRGITVGEVTAVDLDRQLEDVTVYVRLVESATALARAGSQYWVERPTVNITEIRGLDTLVQGRYLAVLPGPRNADVATEFTGLDVPPTGELPSGGLEIVLEGPARGGLRRGAPVTYRGLQVGQIISVRLSGDATTIESRAFIEPAFKNLVRSNTEFWDNSGFDVSFGVTGVQLNAEALSNIVAGGVAMATPDPPGEVVTTGRRFDFHVDVDRKQKQTWLAAQPRIPIGSHLLPDNAQLPQPVRVAKRWQVRRLGIRRDEHRDGWALLLDDGAILAPLDLLDNEADATDDPATLEIEGKAVSLDVDQLNAMGLLATYRAGLNASDVPGWQRQRTRAVSEPEDSLLLTSHHESVLPLRAEQIKVSDDNWQVDPAIPLDSDWHGACWISVRDGRLIGMLVIEDELHRLVPLKDPL